MKNCLFTPFLFLFFFFCSQLHAQKKTDFNSKTKIYTSILNKYHYSPKVIDEAFSLLVMEQFISRMDPAGTCLLDADVKELSKQSPLLKGGDPEKFILLATSIYKSRLKKTDSLITSILNKPFDFSIDESYTSDTKDYVVNEDALKGRWIKKLKSQMLFRMYDLKKPEDSVGEHISEVLKKEAEIRNSLTIITKRKINNVLDYSGGLDKLVEYYFMNSISACFDPHSVFMPLTAKENFVGSVTNIYYSFGLEIDENDRGEVFIAHLTPGGPAWRSGEINKNDVILKAKWDNKEQIDFYAASMEEVERYFLLENHGKMVLSIRKANGLEKSVTLEKEEIRNDENFVKSFVLEGDKKIGYISLPGFYTIWESEKGSSCANDVAKEVLKLKQEGIEGLILDVRDNGGGSLQEAADLAGIFIDEGPLLFMREREGRPRALKDFNRGTIYDGPLILMVNGHSASASDILAAVLKDYNRALIVGDHTFGKSTAQVVLPLDTSIFEMQNTKSSKEKESDYIKITMNKIYRVNGQTSQHSGVAPHIKLPDIFENLYTRESDYPYAILSDSIKKSPYYFPLKELPVAALDNKSSARISASEHFSEMKRFQDLLEKVLDEDEAIPLKMETFAEYYLQRKKILDEIEEFMMVETGQFSVKNNAYNHQKIELDDLRMELNEQWFKNILSNVQIAETYNIMTDFINLTKQ